MRDNYLRCSARSASVLVPGSGTEIRGFSGVVLSQRWEEKRTENEDKYFHFDQLGVLEYVVCFSSGCRVQKLRPETSLVATTTTKPWTMEADCVTSWQLHPESNNSGLMVISTTPSPNLSQLGVTVEQNLITAWNMWPDSGWLEGVCFPAVARRGGVERERGRSGGMEEGNRGGGEAGGKHWPPLLRVVERFLVFIPGAQRSARTRSAR